MLASHTSGLPHPEERTPQLFATHYETATDAVGLFREVELLSPPGAERYLFVSGANPGVQAGLAIYPERRTTAAVLSNTWGVGSRSGEMGGLAQKLAELCAPAPRG